MSMEEKMAALQQAGGMGGGAPQPNAGGVSKPRNLEDCIVLKESTLSNVTAGSDIAYVLSSGPAELSILSDDDEQILMFVKFKQHVNIRHLRIRAATPPAGIDSSPPKIVKIWRDGPLAPNDFSDAADRNALNEIDLSKEHLEGNVDLKVNFLKFQNVTSVTVFIESNQDDEDVTFLNQLEFYGTTIDDFNMNNLKKSG